MRSQGAYAVLFCFVTGFHREEERDYDISGKTTA